MTIIHVFACFTSGICAFQGVGEGGCQTRYQHKRSFSLSLSLLEPGDAILTDQGFTIQVGTSQQLSRVRIHVELVIGLIKNKGQNTQREPYPGSASDVVNIDEIHTICGALTKIIIDVIYVIVMCLIVMYAL